MISQDVMNGAVSMGQFFPAHSEQGGVAVADHSEQGDIIVGDHGEQGDISVEPPDHTEQGDLAVGRIGTAGLRAASAELQAGASTGHGRACNAADAWAEAKIARSSLLERAPPGAVIGGLERDMAAQLL